MVNVGRIQDSGFNSESRRQKSEGGRQSCIVEVSGGGVWGKSSRLIQTKNNACLASIVETSAPPVIPAKAPVIPVPPRLVEAPAAVHPLPQGGEGGHIIARLRADSSGLGTKRAGKRSPRPLILLSTFNLQLSTALLSTSRRPCRRRAEVPCAYLPFPGSR